MTRLMRLLPIASVLTVLASSEGQAATVTAASCSGADVQAAVSAAIDGDTVNIPSCPGGVSWTSAIRVTKGITVKGQGIGATVLLDDTPKGGDSSCQDTSPIFGFTVDSPKNWRLTGLTIRGSASDPFVCNTGHVRVDGTSKAWRIDHIRIENQQTSGIRSAGHTYGVVEHSQVQGSFRQGVIVSHEGWGGHGYGDGSWAEPLSLGTEKAVYVEDCTFTDPVAVGAGAMDVLGGGRVVFRYNTGMAFWVAHGTDSGQRGRSVRSFEIYNNTFASIPSAFAAVYLRGGTGVIFNNAFNGNYPNPIVASNYRDNAAFDPWGQCDGSSPYDGNQSGGGYPCIDQVGRSTGNLISGDSPSPVAWPNQALDPVYQWGNTLNGASQPRMESQVSHVRAGRDFLDNLVKPGYTPFPYPHPLTLSGPAPSPAPAPPSNVRLN